MNKNPAAFLRQAIQIKDKEIFLSLEYIPCVPLAKENLLHWFYILRYNSDNVSCFSPFRSYTANIPCDPGRMAYHAYTPAKNRFYLLNTLFPPTLK
jgi:hypothetical protein